jgi:hypothetical protein
MVTARSSGAAARRESVARAPSELAALAVGFDVIAVRDGRVQRVPQAF